MADDDIESYWEGIRPPRTPVGARRESGHLTTSGEQYLRNQLAEVEERASLIRDQLPIEDQQQGLVQNRYADRLRDQINQGPTTIRQDRLGRHLQSHLDNLRRPGSFEHPTAPAVLPRTPEEDLFNNLTNALAALGFPPQSINLESDFGEGFSLTITMSPSYEFETSSDSDEVSVTFSHRH